MKTRTAHRAAALALFLSVPVSAMIVAASLLHLHTVVAHNAAVELRIAYLCGHADQGHIPITSATQSACDALRAKRDAAAP